MKYYVIEISDGDAKIKGKSIYEYSTRNEALASFHKKLGTAMASELYTSEQILVVDSNNGILAMEKYVADVVEPEPVQEPIVEDAPLTEE